MLENLQMRDLGMKGQNEWNDAYNRGGNIVFYPNEEVVRFLNRFVRKRRGISDFEAIYDMEDRAWEDFKSLDLGCGIGRHVRLLEEFGLNPYGIDLSDAAVTYGKKWFGSMDMSDVSDRLQVASVDSIPFDDGFFDVCISESVLDSMPRQVARDGIIEIWRVLRRDGLFFLSLIMDSQRKDGDVIVDFGYEKGTIQSYFTMEGIESLLKDYFEIVDMNIVTTEDMFFQDLHVNKLNENLLTRTENNCLVSVSKRAYIVTRKRG